MTVENGDIGRGGALAAGDRREVCIAPPGVYPQFTEDGGRVEQVVDAEALRALVRNFEADLGDDGLPKKVLVDRDHDSERGGSTEAMAWIDALRVDPERGLVADFVFTDAGADAVNTGRYRFTSCAWTLDADGRPDRLSTVAFTNRPNLPVPPMLNSKAPGTGAPGTVVVLNGDLGVTATATDDGGPKRPERGDGGTAAAEPDAPHEPKPITTEKELSMDIKEKLGLAPEATDEDVGAAIDALVARAGELDAVENALGLDTENAAGAVEAVNALIAKCENDANELAGIKAEAANAEAERFVAENADEDLFATNEEREQLKNDYLANPAAAQEKVQNARRIRDRVMLNARLHAAPAEPRRTVVNALEARRPVVENSVRAGLANCKTVEEQNDYIRRNLAALA